MDSETKRNLTERGIWLRLVHIIVFAVAFNITEILIAAVTIFQFLAKLITRNANRNLAELGQNLATYAYQVILFLTFKSDDKPFPFEPWPTGAPSAEGKVPAKRRSRAKSARPSDAQTGSDGTTEAPGTA